MLMPDVVPSVLQRQAREQASTPRAFPEWRHTRRVACTGPHVTLKNVNLGLHCHDGARE